MKNMAESALLIGALVFVGAGASHTSGKDGPLAKVDSELRSLFDTYLAAQRSGGTFVPTNPLIQVVEDRVVVDAVAAGDPGALQDDLLALGMKGAVSVGRIVSGQLPISAIGALAALSSLRFARAALAATRGGARGSP
jgi:hypothetical protein